MYPKVVVCGAGFLGSRIAALLLNQQSTPLRRVQLLSRNPAAAHRALEDTLLAPHNGRLEPPIDADITKPDTLKAGIADADVVVSLVGIMHGSPEDFERVQWRGAENVARAAQAAGAKLVHVSAIGANAASSIPYARTKALGEQAVLAACPNATIIRPSLLFGPGDGFFTRFAQLSKVLPVMPVFGGGTTRFQPVFVDDLARLVEILSRQDPEMRKSIDGMVIEAGGPDILTYREIMELVLEYSERWRPIVSVPYAVGTLQGLVLEQLPPNLFTLTRAQVEQLKEDNVVDRSVEREGWSFAEILNRYSSSTPTSVHEVLPSYLPYV